MSNQPYGNYNTPLPGYGTHLVDRINVYLHFRRYSKMVMDRWILLLSLTLIGTGIGMVIAKTTPDRYLSHSMLMINPKMRSTTGASEGEDTAKFGETQVTLMQNSFLLDKVFRKVSEGRDNTNKLSKPRWQAEAGKGNTFMLRVTYTNYDYAQKFAVAWAQEFVEFKKSQRMQLVNSTEASTQRDILVYEQRYERARQATEDFRRRNNITTDKDVISAQERLDQKQAELNATTLQRQIFENATPERLASDEMKTGLSKIGIPGEKSNSGSRTGSGGATKQDQEASERFSAGNRYSDLKLRIKLLENEVEERSKTLKPAHPYLVQMHRDLETLHTEMKGSLEQVEEFRKGRIATLKLTEEGLSSVVENLREEVKQTANVQTDYRHYLEEESYVKNYLDALRKSYQSYAMVGADEEQFAIVEPGGGDPEPVGPNRPLIIGTGVLLGLLSAVALVILLHRLDDRLDEPERIEEELQTSIMGQIPEVDKTQNKEGYLLLPKMKQHAMFAESLRGVRSALLLSENGASRRTLAVTSAVPGDGKTTFTTNFAITLANAGVRVLLIDADLRRGNIAGYFQQSNEEGLTEVLQGKMPWKETIRETGIANLYFMRAGERPDNPSELLVGPAIKVLTRELRDQYDYVIFDCPPLTAIDDTFSIAACLDGLFFVVRAGKTSIKFAKLAINTIRQRNAPLLGLVINGITQDNPYYYYTTYYYASYYHKPDDTEEEGEDEVEEAVRSTKVLPEKTAGSGRASIEPIDEPKTRRDRPVSTPTIEGTTDGKK